MAGTTTDSGAVLLVPMHLDALVVNKQETERGVYNRWRMDYSQMNEFESPMLPPFDDQKTEPPAVGVHLHWALPDGLTHGVENEDGEIEFPFAPNRWLVVRIQPGRSQTGAGPIAAWVILSDELGPHCASSFLDPDPQKSRPGQVLPTRLGDRRTIQAWDEGMGEQGVTSVSPFLRAMGPGNPTFAAFAPGVENVFAFHDDMRGLAATKLTYLVVGWYSQPEIMDPLRHLAADAWQCEFLFNVGLQFQAELDEGRISPRLRQVFQEYGIDLADDSRVAKAQKDGEWLIAAGTGTYTVRLEGGELYVYDSEVTVAEHLNWAVRLEGAPPPWRTCVHGMVYGVDWNPAGESQRAPARPRDVHKQVRVAVGNTTVEALAALISNQAENAGIGWVQAEILEAFQYNLLSMLDVAGGTILLDQNIRQAWFGSEPGGIQWTIVATERADAQAARKPPRVSRDQAAWLDDLNRKQRELDAQRRLLAAMQWELYALWWKSKRVGRAPEPASKDRRAELLNAKTQLPRHLQKSDPESLLSRVMAQQRTVASLEEVVPPATGPHSAERIAAYAQGHLDPDELELKAAAMPRFWSPNDPVIVVTGLGRSEKHGYDATLLCRLLSQTIGEITVPYQDTSMRVTADDLRTVIPHLSSEFLPAGASQLLTEAFFLDPGNAQIVAEAGLRLPAAGDAVAEAINAIKPLVAEGTNAIGRYGAVAWRQPWVPLFLDWQVRFFYTFKEDHDGSYRFDQEDWHFDGSDYSWRGKRAREVCPGPLSYSGRTFLTPQASVPFVARLREYVHSHPDANPQAAEDLLERIAKWDILSQTISGFTYQLALRDVEPNVPPDDTISDYVGPHYDTIPFVNIVPDVETKPDTARPFFFPLRAGFFTFEKLRLIDSFGRVLNLLEANGNPLGNERGFLPIRGRGMLPSPDLDRRLVELPPRVVQGSRLSFRYVSAGDDGLESGLAADSNPVCGWLLPNHLNNSISVYDADGAPLGELLQLLKSKAERTVYWQPAPGDADSSPAVDSQQEVRIPNQHLRNMIEALIHRGDQGAAFDNLLQVIDKTLWTIDPLGERGDQNLSVLIGRPLAVVRANLQLQLNGKPFFNQAWHETFQTGSPTLKENSGGLLDLEFPVQLGSPELPNSGLIGYFQDQDYAHFHAVRLPEGFAAADPPYIHLIGADDDYVRLKFQASRPAAFDPAGSVYLTMLIDPRGVVQAHSGLLPTKTVELPGRYVSEPLERMAVTFRAGPLLLDPQAVRIPQPAEQRGDWSWIEATGTGKGEWATAPVAKEDARARLAATPLVLREGWLKFSPDEVEK
jgi:hypothetical protein